MKHRVLITLLAFAPISAIGADYFETDYFETDYFETDYFETDGGTVAVPDVIGEANAAAADVILEAEGLDTGTVIARCSDAAADEVVGQDPAAGTLVEPASLVNLLTSNGDECVSGRPGVKVRGLSLGL